MESQAISRQEFQSRYDRVQRFLEDKQLGALLAYSPAREHKWGQTGHVSYLSGWANDDRIVETVVVVPRHGAPVMLAAGMQFMFEQAAEVSPIEDMRLVEAVDPNAVAGHRGGDDDQGPRDFAGQTLAVLEENGLGGERVGVVGVSTMPAPFYEGLALGLGDRLHRVDDVVSQLRSVKSEAELQLMRRAAELSDLGFQTMLEVARPGLPGIEIVAEMERMARREGADHAKYWMASGPPPDWNNTRLDIRPHERILQYGDLMASCSYIVYQGYWCHGHRTGTLGKPCEELTRLCQVTREAHDRAQEILKPGTPVADLGRTIREHVEPHGLDLLGGRIGHGIGMDYSEQPVPFDDSNPAPMQAGMTAVMHAVFGLPGTGKMFVPARRRVPSDRRRSGTPDGVPPEPPLLPGRRLLSGEFVILVEGDHGIVLALFASRPHPLLVSNNSRQVKRATPYSLIPSSISQASATTPPHLRRPAGPHCPE